MPDLPNTKGYTIKEVFQLQHQSEFKNREVYKKRDVLKRIKIKEVTEIDRHDLKNGERVFTKFVIESYSYPQYSPYFTKKDKRGRVRGYQRTNKHQYDITLEIDRLSINTKNWKMRVGSGKVWENNPPAKEIRTITKKTKENFQKKVRGKTEKEKKQAFNILVEKHKKQAKYLNVSDWNIKKKGIMPDFLFRASYAYYINGHLFGRNYFGNKKSSLNKNNIVFFTKHQINLLEFLMNKGILKDD